MDVCGDQNTKRTARPPLQQQGSTATYKHKQRRQHTYRWKGLQARAFTAAWCSRSTSRGPPVCFGLIWICLLGLIWLWLYIYVHVHETDRADRSVRRHVPTHTHTKTYTLVVTKTHPAHRASHRRRCCCAGGVRPAPRRPTGRAGSRCRLRSLVLVCFVFVLVFCVGVWGLLRGRTPSGLCCIYNRAPYTHTTP